MNVTLQLSGAAGQLGGVSSRDVFLELALVAEGAVVPYSGEMPICSFRVLFEAAFLFEQMLLYNEKFEDLNNVALKVTFILVK